MGSCDDCTKDCDNCTDDCEGCTMYHDDDVYDYRDKIAHVGARAERTLNNIDLKERAFLRQWQEENKIQPAVNNGFISLELILDDKPTDDKGFRLEPVDAITQRDAFVAASVIQWLGSNVGQGFLSMVERRFQRYKEEQALADQVAKRLTESGRKLDGKPADEGIPF